MENKSKIAARERVSFLDLRAHGYKIQPSSWLVVYWKPNDLPKTRILWNLSRKVGSAVVRNRLKRWSREFIRTHLKDIIEKEGIDFNFVFRPQSKSFYKDLRYEDIKKILARIEEKIRSRHSKRT